MKLLNAGKLNDLNDFIIGSSVLSADGLVGFICGTGKPVINHPSGDICQIQADIRYPLAGNTYHTYRHDGRSNHNAHKDIVRVCRADKSKVKSIKVWSDQPLDPELIDVGNELGLICKLYIDTEKNGKSWTGNKKPSELNGFLGICRLGRSGILSVKVWRDSLVN